MGAADVALSVAHFKAVFEHFPALDRELTVGVGLSPIATLKEKKQRLNMIGNLV